MNTRAWWMALTALVLGSLGASGCTEDMGRASEVTALRVLAVRSDLPFATPGAQPQLEMLYHDGSSKALLPDGSHRPVHILWLGSCNNPDGDLYYNCYPALHQTAHLLSNEQLAQEQVPSSLAEGMVGFGGSFKVTIPDDIISSRPAAPGVVHPYGMTYAFFLACAGELRLDPTADPQKDFPVGCYQPGTNAKVGSDDVVLGYYPTYAYNDVTNHIPQISGYGLDGMGPGAACSGGSQCPSGQSCSRAGQCIPVVQRCTKSDADDCPKHIFQPAVDPSNVEKAVTAQTSIETAPSESIWVSYFTDFGSFDADAKFINDPDMGWKADYAAKWRAPNGAGEARIWAVVFDNRGGVSWVWQDVLVQ